MEQGHTVDPMRLPPYMFYISRNRKDKTYLLYMTNKNKRLRYQLIISYDYVFKRQNKTNANLI